jgi:hypothetical protein
MTEHPNRKNRDRSQIDLHRRKYQTYTNKIHLCQGENIRPTQHDQPTIRSEIDFFVVEKTQRTVAFHFIEKIEIYLHPPRMQITDNGEELSVHIPTGW